MSRELHPQLVRDSAEMTETDLTLLALALVGGAMELAACGTVIWIGWRHIRPWSPRAGKLVATAGALRGATPFVTNAIGLTIGLQLAQPWGDTYRAAGFALNGVIATGTSIAFWGLLVLASLEVARESDTKAARG